MTADWTAELLGQLELHWERQVRPRLADLTDDEYFWEPVPGMWGLRRRVAPGAEGERLVGDFAVPPPEPAPVTTIGWRLRHLVAVLDGMRSMPLFGGPAVDFATFPSPPTAREALAQLEQALEDWTAAVRALSDEVVAGPAGVEGSGLEGWTVAGLVLHVNREVLHHGAEIALLRDLFRASSGSAAIDRPLGV